MKIIPHRTHSVGWVTPSLCHYGHFYHSPVADKKSLVEQCEVRAKETIHSTVVLTKVEHLENILTNYNYLAFKHKPTAVIRWQYVIIVRWQSRIIVIVTNTSRSLTKTLTRTDKIIHFPRSDSHTNKWIVWHSPVFWSFYEHLRSVSGHVWSACQCHWLMSHPILSQNVCLAVIVWFVNRLIDGKQDTFNIAL